MNTYVKKTKITYLILLAAFLFVPFFGFMGILYNDHDLTKFFDLQDKYGDAIINTFTNTEYLPDYVILYSFPIISIGLFIIALIGLMSLMFSFSHEQHNDFYSYKMRVFITILASAVLLVASAALLGYSEYRFSWFNQWVNSLIGGKTSATDIQEYIALSLRKYALPHTPWTQEFIDGLTNDLLNIARINDHAFGPTYNWIGINFVWLVVSIQILLLLSTMLRMGFNIIFHIESPFERKYEDIVAQKQSFNLMFLRRFIQRRLLPNEKNISFAITLTSLITFVPQIIYVAIIGSHGTTENTFINYMYIYPYLFHNDLIFNGSLSQQQIIEFYQHFSGAPGTLFAVLELPIFLMFIVFAFVVSFFYAYVKKHEITQRSYLTFFTIFVIVEVVVICLIMMSQIYIMQAIQYWNNSDPEFVKKITKTIFGTETIPYLWLKSNELISSIVLSFAFLVTFSILEFNKIIQIKNKNVVSSALPKNI